MAEKVQSILDGMVPALAEWKARGLFDATEIRLIVQRRRESEYKIHRRNPQLKDFLQYLETETNLYELFQIRYRRWKRQQPPKDKEEQHSQQQPQKSVGENHSYQFVHDLWERTLRKFRRVELFHEYAEFCRQTKAWNRLSRVYTRAMRYFPHQIPFFIEAASFEYFQRHNITAARVLLQRGLRLNAHQHQTSADLWFQSFNLEMHFVQKMMGRRHILLSQEEPEKKQDKQDEEEDKQDRYAIARLVLDHAMASPADSLEFRLRFIEICRSFPHSESLMQRIQSSIQRDYNTVDAWMARIQYIHQQQQQQQQQQDVKNENEGTSSEEEEEDDASESDQVSTKEENHADEKQTRIQNSKSAENILDVIRQACQTLRTSEMWERALEFLNETSETNNGKSLELIRELLKDDIVKNSPSLVLWYANFMIRFDKDRKAAVQILQKFVQTQDPVPAEIWIQLAGLLYADSNASAAFQIFDTALTRIPMHQPDFMAVLLQYFSARLQARTNETSDLFEKIALLAPGFKSFQPISNPHFVAVTSIPNACWQYLLLSLAQGREPFRKVYEKILYQSNLAKQLIQMDVETMIEFVDKSIKEEILVEHMDTAQKKRLKRLFDTAVQLFHGTPLASEYRKQRDDFLYDTSRRSAQAPVALAKGVPLFDVAEPSFDPSDVEKAYQDFQVVVLKNIKQATGRQKHLSWKDLGLVFQKLNEEDRKSWCVETHGNSTSLEPAEFLDPKQDRTYRAYCSFLIQKDVQSYEKSLELLPCREILGFDWAYERALWIFFGRNPVGSICLDGRPDHTDSVTHDGTWHFQLSGTKRWMLRPTSEILSHIQSRGFVVPKAEAVLQIECKEGDVIILNTRAWFHRTTIPPQSVPSVSYARDFRIQGALDKSSRGNMTNVDGLYATSDIENNTIIFTEKDMPDVELHRSTTDPNCEVVELEDGTNAVVSLRSIAAGEFFTVIESDDSAFSSAEECDAMND